jgi:hypothetical protein
MASELRIINLRKSTRNPTGNPPNSYTVHRATCSIVPKDLEGRENWEMEPANGAIELNQHRILFGACGQCYGGEKDRQTARWSFGAPTPDQQPSPDQARAILRSQSLT